MHMEKKEFRTLIQNLGKFPVECGIITGIIFGKLFVDYVLFQDFSVSLFILGSFFAFFSLILLYFCSKIKRNFCKDQ